MLSPSHQSEIGLWLVVRGSAQRAMVTYVEARPVARLQEAMEPDAEGSVDGALGVDGEELAVDELNAGLGEAPGSDQRVEVVDRESMTSSQRGRHERSLARDPRPACVGPSLGLEGRETHQPSESSRLHRLARWLIPNS